MKKNAKQLPPARRKPGKAAKRKRKSMAAARGCITLLAELGAIACFFLMLYNFIKEFL